VGVTFMVTNRSATAMSCLALALGQPACETSGTGHIPLRLANRR
jgi:hypothetical protein